MSEMEPVPDGIPALTPVLVCRDPAAEVAFCRSVLEARVANVRPGPGGEVAHALLYIGESAVMIEAEWPALASRAPPPDASSPVVLYLYVPDVDATVGRAEAAGARILMPPANRFWGDRTGRIIDPAGHVWTLASRVEEPDESERQRRWSSIVQSDGPERAEG